MRKRSTTPIRLDQAVSGILLRLGGLAAITVIVAVACNVSRSVIADSATTYTAGSEALSLAHAGMLDEETGLRGFLETGAPSFLQPYHAGQDELEKGDADLQRALAGDPNLLTGYIQVRLAQGAWLSGWADVAIAQQPQASTTATFLEAGRALFDPYRASEAALNTAIDATIQHAQDMSNAVATGSLIVEVFTGLTGVVLFWRTRRGLRRAVVGPVSRIVSALEGIADGNYAPPAMSDTGPAELREIKQRLRGVAATLHAAREGVLHREREAAEHAARLRSIVDMGREIAGSLNLGYVL
ncbi:MAG TPA: CHASE3 domain-containing protein, partial [Candidatus Dormibacteraeota bacterium]|nr:CHASE3 domain-containing protein [Candidatus Dormibacteraeota bacterium]